MPNFKAKQCSICNNVFVPTGPCAFYCPSCAEEQHLLRQREGQAAYRKRKGLPVGVGKGGSNIKGWANPQFTTGIGNFKKLRKQMREEIKKCQWCGKDLTDASRYEWCVHHLDHDRTHNVRENLVMLCKQCHQIHHGCHNAFGKVRATTIPKGSTPKRVEAHSPSM